MYKQNSKISNFFVCTTLNYSRVKSYSTNISIIEHMIVNNNNPIYLYIR